jgi:hypothetical protein
MSQQLIDEVGTLMDRRRSTLERAIAARHLADGDAPDIVETLVRIAQDEGEEEWVSHAAGESLAEILFRRGEVDTAPLHEFTGAAYIGFDEAVARLQRQRS